MYFCLSMMVYSSGYVIALHLTMQGSPEELTVLKGIATVIVVVG